VALWHAGDEPGELEGNAAFRVAAGAAIKLRLHYRNLTNEPGTDQSQLALYLASARAPQLQVIELAASPGAPPHRLARRIRAISLRQLGGTPGSWVRLTAVAPNGQRLNLARIQVRDDWARRYVFRAPLTLASGTELEISATPSEFSLWTSLTGSPSAPESPIQIGLEYLQ
jgi:hypothetical protein